MQQLTLSLVHCGGAGGDRQLTERVLLPGKQLRIGSDRRADLVLPAAEIGALGLSVQVGSDGSAAVRLADPPAGALGLVAYQLAFGQDGRRLHSDQARARGLLLDSDRVVRLRVGSRVVVGLGAYRVLLHLGERLARPVAPTQALPRRRLRDILDADPVWWLSLAFVGALVTVLVTQALVYNWQVGRFLDPAPAEVAELHETHFVEVAPAPEPEKEPEQEPDSVLQPQPAPVAEPTPAPIRRAEKSPTPAKAQDDPADTPRRSVRERLAARSITGAFTGAQGASTALFAESDDGDATLRTHFGSAASAEVGGPGGRDAGLVLRGAGENNVARIESRPAHRLARAELAPERHERKERKVNVVLGPIDPVGPGEAPKIRVARLAPKVRRCYEQALRADPQLSGKVDVHAVLGTAGRFDQVRVLGMGPPVSECIEKALLRTRGLPVIARPIPLKMAFVLTPG
ncbi:MAG: hypothetical protein H6747_01725 [Deltaproteobacteria bacterium]|nr:hypothetical protein [Deltaproteobacteria bacterium]